MSFQFVSPIYAAPLPGTIWDAAGCSQDGVATINGIVCLLSNLIFPLPGLIALAAVIMIITAGIRIITAGADAKALASAWTTFQWAVIGLILLLGAWLILVLIKNFTGADVTNFGLP